MKPQRQSWSATAACCCAAGYHPAITSIAITELLRQGAARVQSDGVQPLMGCDKDLGGCARQQEPVAGKSCVHISGEARLARRAHRVGVRVKLTREKLLNGHLACGRAQAK